MPSLNVIINGNADPLAKTYKTVDEMSSKTSSKVIEHMERAAMAIESQMRSVERGTLAWQRYYEELKNVEIQLASFKHESDRSAAAAELGRYLSSPSQSGFPNPRAGAAQEQASFEERRNSLRGMLQTMRELRAESERYLSSPSQSGFPNPRAGMDADHKAWQAKLADYRSTFGRTGLKPEAIEEGLKKAAVHAHGLNLIVRETLVVFREIGRGNWARVPGSLSLIAQGFAQFKKISLLTMGAWAFAIGGIIASFMIFHHRVTALSKSLKTTLESAFDPEHIAKYLSKLEILNQLQKDVAENVRQVREAHDSVSESIQRSLDLTKDRISFERELLEAQKQNDLAAAKTPAARERVEKKYSALILAKKKEERDAEVEAMKKEATQLPGEIAAAKQLIRRITEGDYMTSEHDRQILEQRKAAAAAYDDYRKQLVPGEKDERNLSADKDRKLIETIQKKQSYYEANKTLIQLSGNEALYKPNESDLAKMEAAKTRLKNSADTQKSVNEWMDSADTRERSRLRVRELEDKVKSDERRLAELGPNGTGKIKDAITMNIQKDKEDLALEKERLKRTSNPGRSQSSIGQGMTTWERAGGMIPGISMVDIQKEANMILKKIEKNTMRHASYANSRDRGFGGF